MSVIERNNVHVTGRLGADRTLVCAHGFGTDQRAWSEVIKSFTDTHQIVLFDFVGANEKTAPYFNFKKYTQLYAFADDLLDIMEELNLKGAEFLGHSVGSMTGVLAAIQEPSWFSKLILLNASPRYVNEDGYLGGFSKEDLDAFDQMSSNYYAWASGFASLAMQNNNRPHLAREFAKSLSSMRPDVALTISKVIFYSDHRSDISQLSHPTLLIQAKYDIAVPAEVGYYLRDHISGSTLEIINSEGHFPHISDPQEVIRVVKPFLEL